MNASLWPAQAADGLALLSSDVAAILSSASTGLISPYLAAVAAATAAPASEVPALVPAAAAAAVATTPLTTPVDPTATLEVQLRSQVAALTASTALLDARVATVASHLDQSAELLGEAPQVGYPLSNP